MNNYTFDTVKKGFTHETRMQRRSLLGINRKYKDGWTVDLTLTDSDKLDSEYIDGMSGGIVCNTHYPNSPIKWAGMITSYEKPPQIRFIPAYILHPAILSYKQSSRVILDPAAEIEEQSHR